MNSIELRCRMDRCITDDTLQMELKKCITQNDKSHPDMFHPCPHLSFSQVDIYKKGDVWKRFGDMIDKSKSKEKRRLP